MDSRLFKIDTRPGQLRQQDLPLLARALVAVFRKQAQVRTGFVRNLGYVRLESADFRVQILASDWAKILPFIRDETFNQVVVKSQIDTVVIDPIVAHASPLIDRTDRQYYQRVLDILRQVFLEAYPTSPL